MVKNILILRFGNEFFGATWNRNHIDNVQISFKEPFGTEGRGGYFDEFGIIRDVMQNHLLQVLTLLAMERPVSFSAEDVRDEKVRVLRSIGAIEPKNVIIGQYGKSLDGNKPSYKEDDTVPKDSRCPTFCAMVAYIKNERWDGVPFILKAGKALNEQKTEIRIQFKDVTSGIFKDIPRNELVMRIQPNESVYIKMNSKLPGLSMQTVVTELDLTYRRRFSDLKIPEAYESLILDALKGDHSNFVRDDELDASWKIFSPLLHYLDDNKEIIPMEYPYGKSRPLFTSKPANLRQDLEDPPSLTISPRRTDTSLVMPQVTSGLPLKLHPTSCKLCRSKEGHNLDLGCQYTDVYSDLSKDRLEFIGRRSRWDLPCLGVHHNGCVGFMADSHLGLYRKKNWATGCHGIG